jgi:hypothetical protein
MRTSFVALYLFCCQFIFGQTVSLSSVAEKVETTFLHHHQVVAFYKQVAENYPERTKLIPYGFTPEGRPLMVIAISTEENIKNLESIRVAHLRKIGFYPQESNTDSKNNVALVWLSNSVHGNEPSPVGAGIKFTQKLLEEKNILEKNYLSNTVVLIDPCLNPDGYDRYVHWFNEVHHTLPNPDISSREHQEPWPGGRVNHYYYDLNRDWAWGVQEETRQRKKLYFEWMPHVHVDAHEQYPEDPFYFPPAAQPFHSCITPWQSEFQQKIGMNHSKRFDEKNWLFFTGEIFDLFYPSYGDTYPMFNGAIGMTYEQAGHSVGGSAVEIEFGKILTLKDRVTHHLEASLSTLEVASRNSQKLIEEQESWFDRARKNPTGIYKSYIISKNNDEASLKNFLDILNHNKITVKVCNGGGAGNGFSYQNGKNESFKINEGDWIVSANQNQGTLAQVLLDPIPGLKDSLTYDITAWSLIDAHGLNAWASTGVFGSSEMKKNIESNNSQINENKKPVGWVVPSNDISLLVESLKNKANIRQSRSEIVLEGINYPKGSYFILAAENDKKDFNLKPIYTTKSDKGADLGSSKLTPLSNPKIAVLYGDEIDGNGYGQVWHYFDKKIQFPFSAISVDQLKNKVLKKYEVLIIPEGNFSPDEATHEILLSWVKSGGRCVLVGQACQGFVGKKEIELTKKPDPDSLSLNVGKTYDGQERKFLEDLIGGTVIPINLENTHPLAYGFESASYRTLKTNSLIFNPLKDGWNVGLTPSTPEVRGFMGYKVKKKLGNSLVFGVQNLGSGSMVYLVDNPLFRGFWYSGETIFKNAVFNSF